MFLTVPTELSVWRKQANLSVVEEFKDKTLPPGLEDSLAPDLQDLFDRVRSGVRRSAEIYINLCNMLERLVKRNEGMASENYRFSRALEACTEATSDTYAVDTNDVPMLNEGLNAAAKHLSSSQALLEDEARAWDEGVLEDMKRQRDCLVSARDMFDRRDRYDKDNIPQLEKRIDGNTRKLEALRERVEGVKPGEVEKVEDAIHRVSLFSLFFFQSHQCLHLTMMVRINSALLLNTPAMSSFANAFAMKSSIFRVVSIRFLDCIRNGRRRG